MIEYIIAGDKLTVIKVNSFASTTISEITVDSIQNGRIVFTLKRKQYYLNVDNGMLVLKGHQLGITQASWERGRSCFLMSGDCNIGGLDRETMIALLKTNINELFNQWNNIYWFDGTSDKGDPIFVPRPVSTHYLDYQKEAEGNNAKSAADIELNSFIYSYHFCSKYQDLTDMLKDHLKERSVHSAVKEYLRLGKVVDIIEMSDEAFDALKYYDCGDILRDKGGDYSDDIAEDRDECNFSKFEKETFYAHYTLIRTPSGRAITVDAQGFEYMRYTGLLYHYKTSMAEDCKRVYELLHSEQLAAEKERAQQEEEQARLIQEEKKRIEREFAYLTVTTDRYDKKTAANNLRKVLKKRFPSTKFSVVNDHSDSYTISWTDGPNTEKVDEVANLFEGKGFDGMEDYEYQKHSQFMDRYGHLGYVFTNRKISDIHNQEELDAINKELGKTYLLEDYVTERLEHMSTLVHRRTYKTDYTPVLKPQPESNNKESLSISAQGIEIVDYSEKAFAIIGDTKPIKDKLKELGGCFNGRLSCGAGWIFSKSKLDTVKQTLSIA